MSEILELSRPYFARGGVPKIVRVDSAIFARRYFTHCLEAPCGDWCCSFGVDIDYENIARLMKHADGIEKFIGIPRAEWIDGIDVPDPDYPGGGNQRTRAVGDACVFLDRGPRAATPERNWGGRGCMLHRYALETGIDYHEIKPLMSSLFPLSFEGGEGGCTLRPAGEVADEELVCLDEGPSIYRGGRGELLYYFGEDFVAELDAIEARLPPAPVPAKPRLPVVRG